MKNLKLVFSHKGFIRYFKNTSWLFFEKFLRMAVGITVTVWIARYLGPEKFGLFSYAQAFVILFSSIAALGLDSIVVRELVKDERKRDFIIATAFYLKFVSAYESSSLKYATLIARYVLLKNFIASASLESIKSTSISLLTAP